MTEVTISYAKAYLLDRVGELRQQLSHGNPFVFVGAFALMDTVNEVFHDLVDFKDLPRHMGWPPEAVRLYGVTQKEVSNYFSLPSIEIPGTGLVKFNLSHTEPHLQVNASNGYIRYTLNAASLLDELETVTNSLFDKVLAMDITKTDERLTVESVQKTLNRHKFIGLGD